MGQPDRKQQTIRRTSPNLPKNPNPSSNLTSNPKIAAAKRLTTKRRCPNERQFQTKDDRPHRSVQADR